MKSLRKENQAPKPEANRYQRRHRRRRRRRRRNVAPLKADRSKAASTQPSQSRSPTPAVLQTDHTAPGAGGSGPAPRRKGGGRARGQTTAPHTQRIHNRVLSQECGPWEAGRGRKRKGGEGKGREELSAAPKMYLAREVAQGAIPITATSAAQATSECSEAPSRLLP